jgi:hypothetical protein
VLSIVTWKWRRPDGTDLFGPEYVNRLRAGFARHLALPHQVWCVTDDATGIDPDVRIVPLPAEYRDTPRCRRRMRIFDRAFAAQFGPRILCCDLDLVIVDDVTPLLRRVEPVVCLKVQHAQVYSGAFVLMDAGVLHPLWEAFRLDPEGYPRRAWPRGIGSDQAMLNFYLKSQPPIAEWTDADGFVTYYGAGYERFEHFGIGPNRPVLPPGAKVVVLGSDDKHVLDTAAYPWVTNHWVDRQEARA